MSRLSDNLSSSDDLREYLREKGENHQYYKFYTSSVKVVKAILDTHSLCLSRGSNWNDLQDRANFNPDDSQEIRFGSCMSHMKAENVAMWMLYCKDDGYMIDFGRNVIKDC